MAASQPWLTWANLLTLSRALLIAPLTYTLLTQLWLPAAGLFTLAVVSDIFDGKLARRYDQVSAGGGLFDHATDALMVTLTCWACAHIGLINPLLHWLIPAAFIQYMLDSKSLAGRPLRTSRLGKANGIAYFVVVGVCIGSQALELNHLITANRWFARLLLATTVTSMSERAWVWLRTSNR